MKRIMFYATLLMLSFGNVSADARHLEALPFSDIEIGMSFKELMERHPSEKILFPKGNDSQSPEKGVVMYEFSTNKFWDSLMVQIADTKVQSLAYSRINRELLLSKGPSGVDFSNVARNVQPLFNQLKQQLGETFEKKIVCRHLRETKIRSAMYVWKREKDVVVLIHMPVGLYTKGNIFDCQLTIAPTVEYFSPIMATDNIPEDATLWADAMDE